MANPKKPDNAPVVLVVEDDTLTRVLAVAAFDDGGFVVLETASASQALAVLHDNADCIHAVFTDVDMPGPMNGLQLAVYARRRWPSLGVVVASGQSQVGPADMPAGARFFSKPYNTEHVVAHIRDIARAA
jgi:two-component system, response regulator PdtaR